ncbi:MAG TPA: MBL fold metallo-hydrolase [Allosphingosinicella sp.]|nr:MBL fold metallo-hydrolase [Allosphingosinicella sp.]
MRPVAPILAALLCLGAAAPFRPGWHLVPGQIDAQGRKGPDGNSIFLDAPEGLILVDTGRHPAHSAALLAYARQRGRPIAAIVNTHWHLDHNTGNGEVRAAFPAAPLYASAAIEGALTGFLPESRRRTEQALAAGQIPESARPELRRAFDVMDHPERLRPTRTVTRSGPMTIAGRRLRVNLAPWAATEGDVWLYDPALRLAIVGDLVVGPVPFMDTACPEGWRDALDRIAATPFVTLIPGHGAPMDRPAFLAWRAAYNAFVECGRSDRPRADCIAGWRRGAARFIPAGSEALVERLAGYYLDSRLRAAPEERRRQCIGRRNRGS